MNVLGSLAMRSKYPVYSYAPVSRGLVLNHSVLKIGPMKCTIRNYERLVLACVKVGVRFDIFSRYKVPGFK